MAEEWSSGDAISGVQTLKGGRDCSQPLWLLWARPGCAVCTCEPTSSSSGCSGASPRDTKLPFSSSHWCSNVKGQIPIFRSISKPLKHIFNFCRCCCHAQHCAGFGVHVFQQREMLPCPGLSCSLARKGVVDPLAGKREFQRVPDFPGAGELPASCHGEVLRAGAGQNMQSWLRLPQLQGSQGFTSTF